jgi:hypothetical protein
VQAWRGFVAKFNPVTSAGGVLLAYATYLGGHTSNLGDYISGIAIDSASNAYVVGYTNSKDFPVTSGAYGSICGVNGTCAAAHVTKLNPLGTAILWSTYVGGGKSDGSDALFFTGPIQLDGRGNVYIMGQAGPGFPLVNPVEPAVAGGSMELAIAELDPAGANLLFFTRIGSGGQQTSGPAGLAVDSSGNSSPPPAAALAATTVLSPRSHQLPRKSRRLSTPRAPNRAFPPVPGFPSTAPTWHIPRACGGTAKFSAASCPRCWMESL